MAFANDSATTQEEFGKENQQVLAENYIRVTTRYQNKQTDIQQQAVPVFKNIRTTQVAISKMLLFLSVTEAKACRYW
ncbi:MAG: hypothetical protein IPP79_20130 [Chitinophagaceae bacterium]|nr:hypothetical protein [Chitinophagaceae bacterium]